MKRILLCTAVGGSYCLRQWGQFRPERKHRRGCPEYFRGTEEQGQTEEPGEGQQSEADASEIIDQAVAEWEDVSSYEARQTFTISSGDDQNVVRTISKQREQDEVKVEVDNGSEVDSYYVIDGDHFTYEDGSINEEATNVDMGGSTYGEIVQSLEAFKAG